MTHPLDIEMIVDVLRGHVLSALLGETDWNQFLDALCGTLPNGSATLFYHDTSTDRGAFSLARGMSSEARLSYAEHFSSLNPWMAGATRRPIGLPAPDSAMFARSDLERSEFYNDYLLPNDLRGAVGITIDRQNDCSFFLSVLGDISDTAERRDVLEILRAVTPDLSRAFQFYRRVPITTETETCSSTSPTPAVGTLTIGPRRGIRRFTGRAKEYLAAGDAMSEGLSGRVEFRDRRVSSYVDACLRAPCIQEVRLAPRVFLVARDAQAPLKITVMTMPWAKGTRFFRGPECIVLIEEPGTAERDLTEVAGLFSLTQAELRVASGMAAGLSPQEIAADAGVSNETVRTHLRALFAKTDTHRQPELVRLLLTLSA